MKEITEARNDRTNIELWDYIDNIMGVNQIAQVFEYKDNPDEIWIKIYDSLEEMWKDLWGDDEDIPQPDEIIGNVMFFLD